MTSILPLLILIISANILSRIIVWTFVSVLKFGMKFAMKKWLLVKQEEDDL